MFSGITYTDAHVQLGGTTLIAIALALGAIEAGFKFVARPGRAGALRRRCRRWCGVVLVQIVPGMWQLYCEAQSAGQGEALHRLQHRHDAESVRAGPDCDARVSGERGRGRRGRGAHQATLENIRPWDWHALQETLRHIQEIRTTTFSRVDIDRMRLPGGPREVMLGARELSLENLPESSRNWINEKLIYTHGYG